MADSGGFQGFPFWNWFESWVVKYSNRAVRSRLSNRTVGIEMLQLQWLYIRNIAVKMHETLLREECEGWCFFLVFNYGAFAKNKNWNPLSKILFTVNVIEWCPLSALVNIKFFIHHWALEGVGDTAAEKPACRACTSSLYTTHCHYTNIAIVECT